MYLDDLPSLYCIVKENEVRTVPMTRIRNINRIIRLYFKDHPLKKSPRKSMEFKHFLIDAKLNAKLI
ncbi:MAG: hypothetical protein EBQ87_12520 [Planctomycetes bacterium]|nr:hypothetical protein [Planctomycetota bacterium]